MKTAIISDIHANLEAFQSVFEDIKTQGVSAIISLGDVIGYGPNPRECLKLVRQHCKFSLKGNHEEAVLYIGIDFHIEAGLAVDWTRNEINSSRYNPEETESFWNYLGELSKINEVDNCLFVHGSPRDPIREYLRPADAQNEDKIQENFNLVRQICFCGHTHEPGVFVQYPDSSVCFFKPAEIQSNYQIDENKCIINVGSVGQPRDDDNRACYVILSTTETGEKSITFRRISYDYKETVRKILGTKVLPKVLAARLQVGK